MNYFDTSVLVPFFLHEKTSSGVEDLLTQQPPGEATVSVWTHVEFSSMLARHVRIGALSSAKAIEADFAFDSLMAASFVTVSPAAEDFDLSRQFLRRYDTGLRPGDALHLAIASNRRARAIYSLDQGFLRSRVPKGRPTPGFSGQERRPIAMTNPTGTLSRPETC